MVLKEFNILEQLALEPKFSEKQFAVITDPSLDWIRPSLGPGDDFLVSGFGTLCVKCGEGRKGRNPATGKDAILPAGRGVTFKRYGKLCEKANQIQ